MSAEGVRETCDAVCTGFAISQAKGQGFDSTEEKHHVYGIPREVDSFIDFFIFLLITYFLLFYAVRSGFRAAWCDPQRRGEIMTFTDVLVKIDDFVWGVPLIVLIMAVGIFLTFRLKLLQILHLPKALRFMFQNENGGKGEISSFAALCTALSATIGTGNIVGVATAVGVLSGGPGALLWMWIAALLGMAIK